MPTKLSKIKDLQNEVARLSSENVKLRSLVFKNDKKPKVKAPASFQSIFDKAEKTVGDYFKNLKFEPSKGCLLYTSRCV